MKLPELKHRTPPDWMRERLARWLRDWQLDRAIRSQEAGNASETRETRPRTCEDAGAAVTVAPFEDPSRPARGQVRLFSPEYPPCREAPLYVLILDRLDDDTDSLVVVPFSRFTEPATDEEFLLEGLAPGLRVVQIWNAMILPGKVVSRSWLAATVSGDALDAARAVYRHTVTGEELPASAEKLVGSPLLHPDDPRHDYIEEEAACTGALQSYLDAMQDRPTPPLVYERPTSTYAVAADRRHAYALSQRFVVQAAGVQLRGIAGSAPDTQVVRVETPAGDRDDTLNGGHLRSESGIASGLIEDAGVTVPSALLAEPFVVVSPDGHQWPVTPI